MIFKLFLSLLPVVFLIHLFSTDYLQSKKGIKQDGRPPINRYVFFGSKYAVILIWTGMILDLWNVHIPGNLTENPTMQNAGIAFWIVGFVFLFIGKVSLGSNFRIGVANEKTEFIAKGIYRISRNPMYLGLYLSFGGSILYSLNIVYISLSLAVIGVHHIITLAEEKQLINIYGDAYKEYTGKVRRYL